MPELNDYKTLVEAALAYGTGVYTYEDIEQMVHAGVVQVWPGAHSVILTEILGFPTRQVVNVFLAAGDLAEIETMTPMLEAWAKEKGCAEALFTGRAGWERTFLARTGWTTVARVFRKVL